MIRKIILCFCCCCSLWVAAQRKIAFEQIRCFNSDIPISNYLRDPDITRTIASQLGRILFKKQDTHLTDSTKLNVSFLNYYSVPAPIEAGFTDKDSALLHLYIDFFETDPFYFFRNPKNKPEDTTLTKRSKTVFEIGAWVVTADRKIIFHKTLSVAVTQSETMGMGILYDNGIQLNGLAILPRTFTEFMRTCFDLVFDPANDLSQVELKLQPAFLVNNALLAKTQNLPRTFVASTKGISSFRFKNGTEIIRMGEPVYEQIFLKGKNAQQLPRGMADAIKLTDHYIKSDYVFLKQDGRDVGRDKNFQIQLVTQIDPEKIPEQKELMFTNFLEGNFHCMLAEKDTLATFSIRKNVFENSPVYVNAIFNGVDSSSIYTMKKSFRQPSWQPGYEYIVDGKINHIPFFIKCSGKNTLKEIYLNDQLVCMAQGKLSIEKFVLFDASLSPELLNPLLMLAFNRFFE